MYKKLLREIVHLAEETRNEYYGNYSIYAIKFVNLKESSITKKWMDFFAKNKKPTFEKITKRI